MAQAISNSVTRIVDLYIGQYFGQLVFNKVIPDATKSGINDALNVIESLIIGTPYVAGNDISLGDCSLAGAIGVCSILILKMLPWPRLFNCLTPPSS